MMEASNKVSLLKLLELTPAPQGTVAVILPQEHEIVVAKSHRCSGHDDDGWQGATQVCLQSLLGAPQTCPQEIFTPDSGAGDESQGGGWQILAQAWIPHFLAFPQS